MSSSSIIATAPGVIWQVRDAVTARTKDKKTGGYVDEETDAGVSDKRLLVLETEFASPLRHMERSGNTLSATLRNLWDSGSVSSLTKNSPAKTTGSIVSVIGHVTVEELRRYLTRTEMGNGFANRIIFACVRRSKELPFGGDAVDTRQVVNTLKTLLTQLYGDRRIGWGADAAPLWREAYNDLSEGRPSLTGAVTSRAEAQVLRISLIYALLDRAEEIQTPHLRAGLAVWSYCEQSATVVFGNSTGDPLSDKIFSMLSAATDGMTRSALYMTLGKHKSRDQIGEALGVLLKARLTRSETKPTGGRPEERWFAL